MDNSKDKVEESVNFLDNIISIIGNPVFVKDDQSRFLIANDAFCKLFRLERGEIIGKTLAEDVPGHEQESFLRIDKQVLMDGKENINEETLTIRDAKTQIVSTKKTRFIDENGKKFLVGVSHIITERKKAEDNLERSRSLLKAAMESTADGILVVGKDGFWSDFNQKFIDMWRIPAYISKSGDDQAALEIIVRSLAAPEKFMAKVKELYDNQRMNSFDMFELKDGRVFERYSQPQLLADEVIGRVWSFRDITQRKQTEDELEKHRDKLEKLVKDRTKELEDKIKELNNAMKVFVGRELTIRDLQKRIVELGGK
ncbi:MAG: PAS domain-containing protein [Bacteroidota bacterium]|nr:PAS domain-containing protein [Bacteroidota bacterium]